MTARYPFPWREPVEDPLALVFVPLGLDGCDSPLLTMTGDPGAMTARWVATCLMLVPVYDRPALLDALAYTELGPAALAVFQMCPITIHRIAALGELFRAHGWHASVTLGHVAP